LTNPRTAANSRKPWSALIIDWSQVRVLGALHRGNRMAVPFPCLLDRLEGGRNRRLGPPVGPAVAGRHELRAGRMRAFVREHS
jgi:hypothetical protein